MLILLSTEHAIITQSLIALVVTGAGIYFNISRFEWIAQIFAIGFVLAIEGLNTAVEKLCDFIHPKFHNKIGFIKDVSAGAVAFAATFAIIIAVFIYYPYFI
ncbi:hypothetical protein GCM10011506_08090 [Marivirga lumbricoides]|uniref:Diacylglycerol kinase n=2 Tax=Marivirga lumbricoides TaxID=1046115 RepID=A0ABQ1LJW5_9BACT|nr:hypothetical protein GCM10011506_08090 [Marivirga lumbricoides]